MTVLSLRIFSGAGDRTAQKMYSYVEPYDYVEVYDGLCIVLVCSGVVYDRACSYNIFWCTLLADLNRIP